MKSSYCFYSVIFLATMNNAMYITRPVSPQELALVASVTQQASPDFLKLTGTLIDGTQVIYSEKLSGENAGLATCSIVQSPYSPLRHSMDESSPDYWHKILTTKLIP